MKIRSLSLCGLFGALLAICGWLSIPIGPVSVTMQTFGVFLSLLVLGGKLGTVSVLVFLCLGAVGAPVFSGFQGGLPILFGPSGGFLVGFLLMGLLYWLITGLFGDSRPVRFLALVCGLTVCYLAGFLRLGQFNGGRFFHYALPFFLADCVKLALAWYLAPRIRRKL